MRYPLPSTSRTAQLAHHANCAVREVEDKEGTGVESEKKNSIRSVEEDNE